MNRILEGIAAWLLIIGCFTILVLLQIAPGLPKTAVGWIVVIVVGIPAYLLVEGGGGVLLEKIDRSRIGKWVTNKTSGNSFSLLRVGFKLLVALIFISVGIVLWLLTGDYLKPVLKPLKDFLDVHFTYW